MWLGPLLVFVGRTGCSEVVRLGLAFLWRYLYNVKQAPFTFHSRSFVYLHRNSQFP